MADHQSLIRIIGNLIKNAVHYGKDGKVLGIELTETTNDFQLLIWDQGSGISNVDIGNVFERMYRSDYSRNNSFGGSGLGLSIAKELVEKTTDEFGLKAFRGKNDFWFFHPQTQ